MRKTYMGESEAQSSIEWLNLNGAEEERKAAFERVANILANLKALAPLTRGEGEVNESALGSLQRHLGKFRLAAGAQLNRDTGLLELKFYDGTDPDSWLFGDAFRVVLDLYRFAQMGFIDRISHCPVCGKWFFAKLPQHLCCTNDCRKEYEKTPGQKRLRNERLKRNRGIQRDSAAEVKKMIGYSKPKSRAKRRSK